MAAAATVVLASRTGMPVSTTHIAVGGVIGVGMARGIGALDLRVIGGIIMSWVITLPIGGSAGRAFLLHATRDVPQLTGPCFQEVRTNLVPFFRVGGFVFKRLTYGSRTTWQVRGTNSSGIACRLRITIAPTRRVLAE